MSVMHFSARELGTIAAAAVPMRHDDYGARVFRHTCEALARYSAANAAAYAEQYREPCEGWTAAEIAAAAPLAADLVDALRKGSLLAYNAVTNNGTDKATASVHADIAGVLAALSRRAADRLVDAREACEAKDRMLTEARAEAAAAKAPRRRTRKAKA